MHVWIGWPVDRAHALIVLGQSLEYFDRKQSRSAVGEHGRVAAAPLTVNVCAAARPLNYSTKLPGGTTGVNASLGGSSRGASPAISDDRQVGASGL